MPVVLQAGLMRWTDAYSDRRFIARKIGIGRALASGGHTEGVTGYSAVDDEGLRRRKEDPVVADHAPPAGAPAVGGTG